MTVRESPAATATSVSASNLLLGHGLLLRLAALSQGSDDPAVLEQQGREQAAGQEPGPSQQAAPQPSPAASPQRQVLEQLRQRLEDSAASSEVAAASGAAAAAPDPAGEQEQAAASAEQDAEAGNGPLSAESSEGSTSSRVSLQQQPEPKQQRKQADPRDTHRPVAASAAQQQAAAAAAPPPLPSKQTLTSIQLTDCRLVLRYQPGLHPAGSGNGGGSGIPAATHDFLSIHQDLVALDVPLLRLQLPLDPASLSAAATREAAAVERSTRGTEQAASPAGGSSSTTPAGGSPATVSSSGSSNWQDSPSVAPSSSTGAASRPLGQQQQQQQQQVLAEASRLTLSVASVGYARHAMLPLLQLPSLRLACTTSAAPSCASAAAYQLDVAALDIGLHPSQLSMLTSAVQLCQHELAVLGREPPDSSADTESMVTSASGAGEQQPLLRRPVSAPLRPAAAALAGGSPSAHAAAGAEATPRDTCPQPGDPDAGTPGRGSLEQVAAPSQQLPQWRLEAAVDIIGLSLLGLAPSSSCLKLEWQGLRAAYAAGGGPTPQPGKLGSSTAGCEAVQQQELMLSWQQVSLHVLTPHLSYTHPGITPFACAAAFAAGGSHRRGSQHSNLGGGGGGSPQAAPGSPRSISLAPPGGAARAASASEVLWQRGRGPVSSSGAAAAGGVRRNLSVGLGLAGGPGTSICHWLWLAATATAERHCSHTTVCLLWHLSVHIHRRHHHRANPLFPCNGMQMAARSFSTRPPCCRAPPRAPPAT